MAFKSVTPRQSTTEVLTPKTLMGESFKGYMAGCARICALCKNHQAEIEFRFLKSDCADLKAKEIFSKDGTFQNKINGIQVGWFCPSFQQKF